MHATSLQYAHGIKKLNGQRKKQTKTITAKKTSITVSPIIALVGSGILDITRFSSDNL